MSLFFTYLVIGLVTGSVYAIAASGLVLTYSTSRILNFAHGAVGVFVAYVCYWLWVELKLPWWIAVPVAVIVVGGGIGVLLDITIMRWLEKVPSAQRIAITLALLVTFQGVTILLFGPQLRMMPAIIPSGSWSPFEGVFVTYNQLLTLFLAAAVAVGLWILFKRTRLGTTMRAVVEDRPLAEMHGVRPHRVTSLTWAMGSALAGLAAILIAPSVTLNVADLSLLIISSYAAAMVGRLTSVPVTFVAAMGLGIGSSLLIGYLPNADLFVQSLSSAFPFLVLFIALIIHRNSQGLLQRIKVIKEPAPPKWRTVFVIAGVGFALTAVVSQFVSPIEALAIASGFVYVILLLSLLMLTGLGGQVSLAQATFMGLGAMILSHAASVLPYWLAFLVAVVGTAIIGGLIAIPALRLSGVYLGLLTLAFAILVDQIIFINPTLFASAGTGLSVPVPNIFGWELNSPATVAPLAAAFAIAMALVIVFIRKGSMGRTLSAMRDSPAAASALGLRLLATKVLIFATAAGMAAIGGMMMGAVQQLVTAPQFGYTVSLMALLIATLWGISSLPAAFAGAAFYVLGFVELPRIVTDTNTLFAIQQVGIGLAVFGMARHPEGVYRQLADSLKAKRMAKHPERYPEPPSPIVASTAKVTDEITVAPLALRAEHVAVNFGGLKALNDVTIAVEPGTVVGLIGPNGSGKSTMLSVLSGLRRPNGGTVIIGGKTATNMTPASRARLGMARTFQRLELWDSMTVYENILASAELASHWNKDIVSPAQEAEQAIRLVGIEALLNRDIAELSSGQGRLVEVARALAQRPSLALFDEPTAGLNEEETKALGELLRKINRRGTSIVLVEHHIEMVMSLCEYIYVLDFGKLICEGNPEVVRSDPRVREVYLGTGHAAKN